ncbi:hypothetical protein RRG08_033695 [Elysia crispata]|uniref:Uncharacterized protein n=1 Tax=Elysia crispata TaxID=231223 RepID=A0AAE1A9G0_9GAST|nr:hypothetical protein RRG08_033695 [Elysia crispata]
MPGPARGGGNLDTNRPVNFPGNDPHPFIIQYFIVLVAAEFEPPIAPVSICPHRFTTSVTQFDLNRKEDSSRY